MIESQDTARKMIEGTAALYAARLGTPLLLAAIGALAYGAWGDLKKVGDTLTTQINTVSDRVHALNGKVDTEIQVRMLSDEEIKRRLRELERVDKRSELVIQPPSVSSQ